MNLDNIRVEIRPRSSLEAIDLGFAMARQWFIPLWLIWIAAVSPVFLLTHLIFFKHLTIMGWVIWWLKPVYERPLVFWLSRALFNEKPSYQDIKKLYFKIIKPRLFADLTYLRLSPNRSFFMPIAVLENLKGKEHSNRVKVLGHNQSLGIGLTFISVIFEIILTFSIMAVVFFILPEDIRWTNFNDFISGDGNIESLINSFIGIVAMSIMAPFYVAAGFSLYINRRTELEAWDIEISFKRLMARRAEKKRIHIKKMEKANNKTINKSMNTAIGLFFLVTTCFIIFSNSAYADSGKITSKKEASIAIEKVLEHDDFGKKKIETAWKLKEFDKVDFQLPQWLKDFLESFRHSFKWMQNIPKFAGTILELFAWIAG
ncbi:MAG: hypothetical protein GY707_03930, partial [Desulfobacteraceae bacterium]|nr:hypothetical protein [Desulfobacteraceae bacterium]